MGELADALAKGKTLSFAGREWNILPLDFNDLCDLEDEIGALEALDLSTLRHQREVLWLTLRKADPTLPREYRDNGQYKMTRRDVGALLTAEELQKPETGTFLVDVLRLSGVLPRKADGDREAGQDAQEVSAPKKTAAEATSPSDGASAATSIS